MIEFIVAVDPRPNTKARHFVSVAQALGRSLVTQCCHAGKRDRFSAHRKSQKVLDRLGLLRHIAPPFTHFFPRRAIKEFSPPDEVKKAFYQTLLGSLMGHTVLLMGLLAIYFAIV